jgi:hypothetical protein
MNAPKLQCTKNYGLFEMHEFNRPLHDDPVLMASMQRYGFLPQWPISCERNGTDKLKVIAGHHRLFYAKQLELPVWYVASETHVDICDIEGSKKSAWSMSDHIQARAAAGSADYLFLLNFAQDHGLPILVAANLVSGQGASSNNATRTISTGGFRVGDMTHAYAVVEITDYCYSQGIVFARTSPFLRAISSVLRVPEFDTRLFLHRATMYPAMMNKRGTAAECLQEIEALYNYTSKSDQRVPLAFRAIEIGRVRQRTFGKDAKP